MPPIDPLNPIDEIPSFAPEQVNQPEPMQDDVLELTPPEQELSFNPDDGTVGGDLSQIPNMGDLGKVFQQARDNPTTKGAGLLNPGIFFNRSPDSAEYFKKQSNQVTLDYAKEMGQISRDTGKDPSLLQQLWGTAKAIGRQTQAGLQYAAGLDEKDVESLQHAFTARQYIGELTDPDDIQRALSRGADYKKEVSEGKSIAQDDGSLIKFGAKKGTLFTAGMTLGRAQEYLNDLNSDRRKALGTAGLRNFAVNTGDTFLPFIGVGDIVIDEKDFDQVAKRAALTEAINEVVGKDYLGSTLAGSVLGSVSQFALGGGLAAKAFGAVGKAEAIAGAEELLGKEMAQSLAKTAAGTEKTATPLSQTVLYGTMGASQSLKNDPRDLPWYDRLASIGSEGISLALAEELSQKFGEDRLMHAFASDISKGSVLKNKPLAGALATYALGAGAMTAGEFTSDVIQNILTAQDPVARMAESLAAAGGAGLGMRALGFRSNYRQIQYLVNQYKAVAYRDQISAVVNDPGLDEETKQAQIESLRNNIEPQFTQLFTSVEKGVRLKSALDKVDPSISPETHKVLAEQTEQAGMDVTAEGERIANELSQKVQEPEAPPAPSETIAPAITSEQPVTPVAEAPKTQPTKPRYVDVQPGTLEFKDIPANDEETQTLLQSMIDSMGQDETPLRFKPSEDTNRFKEWANGNKDIYAIEDKATGVYTVLGVRDSDGVWYGDPDPYEVIPQQKDQFLEKRENSGDYSEEELDKMYDIVYQAKDLKELDELEKQFPENKRTEEEKLAEKNQQKATEQKAFRKKLREDVYNNKQQAVKLQEEIDKLPPGPDRVAKQNELERVNTQAEGLKQKEKARIAAENDQVADEQEKNAREKYGNGKLIERGEAILASNKPGGVVQVRLANSKPHPLEDNTIGLGEVFDLNNANTFTLLEDLGAISETGDFLMTPNEVIIAYSNRQQDYFNNSPRFKNYKGFDAGDQIRSAIVANAQDLMRQNKKVTLSTIFKFELGDFFELAIPRLRAGVGGGAVQFIEGQSEQSTASGDEVTQEEAVDEAPLEDQVAETLGEQTKNAEYKQSAKLIVEELKIPFRSSLKNGIDAVSFEWAIGMRNLKSAAAAAGMSEQTIKRRGAKLFAEFQKVVKAEYQTRQAAGNLPVPVQPKITNKTRKGDTITDAQVASIIKEIRLAQELAYIDADLYENLLNGDNSNGGGYGITISRDAQTANVIISTLEGIEAVMLSTFNPEVSIKDAKTDIDFFKNDITEKQYGAAVAKFEKIKEEFNKSQQSTDPVIQKRGQKNLRDSLVLLTKGVRKDAKYETAEDEAARNSDERAVKNLSKRTKGVVSPTVITTETAGTTQPEPSTVTRPEGKQPTQKPAGGDAVAEAGESGQLPNSGGVVGTEAVGVRGKGPALPKKFVFPFGAHSQINPNVRKTISPATLQILFKEQIYDLVSAISAMDESQQRAFLLANGPGTGKSFVLMGAAKHYAEQGKKVIYISSSTSFKSIDWLNSKVEGSIAKAAEALGVPLVVRGAKEGKPLTELFPGKVIVTTYNYLDDVAKLVRENPDAIVLFDEHQSVRGVHKAEEKKQAKGQAQAVLALEISLAADKVLFASGTPFEKAEQLKAYTRLGIFDKASFDQVMKGLGQVKAKLGKSNRSTWIADPALTLDEIDDRQSKFLKGLSSIGLFSSRSFSLEGGVTINRVDVPVSEEAKESLDFIRQRYPNPETPGAEVNLIIAQRRVLEGFKVNAACDLIEKEVARGHQVVLYVSYVKDSEINNPVTDEYILGLKGTADLIRKELARRKSAAVVAELHGEAKGPKGQDKQSIDLFQKERADVLITTLNKGGVGIELDDKYGPANNGRRRSIIMLTPSITAIDTVQGIYRAWRLDTASPVDVYMFISDTDADQWALDRHSARIRALNATMEAGFDKLDVNDNPINKPTFKPQPTEVEGAKTQTIKVEPVTKPETPTSKVENKINTALKEIYPDGTYNVEFDNEADGPGFAYPGQTDEDDRIVINPTEILNAIEQYNLTEEQANEYIAEILAEEIIHVEDFRNSRSRGEDIEQENTRLGRMMSTNLRRYVAEFYYVKHGIPLNNETVQKKVNTLMNDPYLIALEYKRILTRLRTFGTTAELSSLGQDRQSAVRAYNLLKTMTAQEQPGFVEKLLEWLKNFIDTLSGVETKLGASKAPNAQALKTALEEVRKDLENFVSEIFPEEEVFTGESPNALRQPTKLDFGDLRLYRQINNFLEGNLATGILGVMPANDNAKTMPIAQWINALTGAFNGGLITKEEYMIYKAATEMALRDGKVSLYVINNNALKVTEDLIETPLEEGGIVLPAEAFVPFTKSPVNVNRQVDNMKKAGVTVAGIIESLPKPSRDEVQARIDSLEESEPLEQDTSTEAWQLNALKLVIDDIDVLGDDRSGAFPIINVETGEESKEAKAERAQWMKMRKEVLALREKIAAFNDGESPAEQDENAIYKAAVLSQNILLAQKIVDDNLRAEGFNLVGVWHGTSAEAFPAFSTDPKQVFESTSSTKSPQFGAHFGSRFEQAESSGKNVYRAAIKLVNPIRLEDPKNGKWNFDSIAPQLLASNTITQEEYDAIANLRKTGGFRESALQRTLIQKGYDGVVYTNNFEGKIADEAAGRTFVPSDSYIVFSNTQIKQADPIVRDSRGTVIDIKQRFPRRAAVGSSPVSLRVTEQEKADYNQAAANNQRELAGRIFEKAALRFARPYPSTNYANTPLAYVGFKADGTDNQMYEQSQYSTEIVVAVKFEGQDAFIDGMKGLNFQHALERARRNWSGAVILPVAIGSADPITFDSNNNPIPLDQRLKPDTRIHTVDLRLMSTPAKPFIRYNLALPGYEVVSGVEKTPNQALVSTINTLYKINKNQPINFEGESYSFEKRKLLYYRIQNSTSYAYVFSKVGPVRGAGASPAGRIEYSKAVNKLADLQANPEIEHYMRNAAEYKQQPKEVLMQKARDFVELHGVEQTVSLLLADNLAIPFSLETAIALQVVSDLNARADEDPDAAEDMANLQIFLTKKYFTEAGRSVELAKVFNIVAGKPTAMNFVINKTLEQAAKHRIEPYLPELNDIDLSLANANGKAVNELLSNPGVKKVIDKLEELTPKTPTSGRVSGLLEALRRANQDQVVIESLQRFKRRLGKVSAASRPDDEIRLNKDAINDLAEALLAHINIVSQVDPEAIDVLFEDFSALRSYYEKMGLTTDEIENYGKAAAISVQEKLTQQVNKLQYPVRTLEESEEKFREVSKQTKAKKKVVVAPTGNTARDYGIAFAKTLANIAANLDKEPVKAQMMTLFKKDFERNIRQEIKRLGGLQEKYERPAPPTAGEKFKGRIANLPFFQRALDQAISTLRTDYTEDQVEALEPLIDGALDFPLTVSDFKAALNSKDNIQSGVSVNIKNLIRQSNGDVVRFGKNFQDAMLKDTNLSDEDTQKVKRYLMGALRETIRLERIRELESIKRRMEKRAEKKTRKIRSALDRLIEATNLGALRDDELFSMIRQSIGLPEITAEVRAEIDKRVKNLARRPEGMLRQQALNDLLGFIKTSAPIAWGDMLVDFQTFNLLASVSTLGVNTYGGTVQVLTDVGLMALTNGVEGLFGNTAAGKAGFNGIARLFQVALPKWMGGEGLAWDAMNVIRKGDLSAAQDMASGDYSTVNMFQAMKQKIDNVRKGKLSIEDAYQEINLPFGLKFSLPLNPFTATGKVVDSLLSPPVWVSQAMAMGDAFNKLGAKKAMEIAEAYRLAGQKYSDPAELDAEAMRLLNYTPEARNMAIAQAEEEAERFNLNPFQKAMRVEEIIEQGRDQAGQQLTDLATQYAKRSTFTNDFEGSIGRVLSGLQTFARTNHWSARTIFKFLKTASSLTNESLNWIPAWSLKRLIVGAGTLTEKGSKFRTEAPTPGTNAYNIQVGKVVLGHAAFAILLAVLRSAGAWGPDREDDPIFMIHNNGPDDPAQAKAFRAAGGRGKSIQIGSFKSGNARFISWETLPFGMVGFLMPLAIVVEAQRYSKRSDAEALTTAAAAALPMVGFGFLDLAFMNGLKRVFNAAYPQQQGAEGRLKAFSDFVGNLGATTFVPAYATLRDLESTLDGLMQTPSGKPAQVGITSAFLRSIPFATSIPGADKIARPDLTMLGTPIKVPLLRGIPLAKRAFSLGADINSADPEERVFALLAAKRVGIDWSPSSLSDIAVKEVQDKIASGSIAPGQAQRELSNAVFLGKRLNGEEKYDWMQLAGPDMVKVLSNPRIFNLILNTEDPNVIREIVSRVTNPIKKAALMRTQLERMQKQQGLKQ
jgi:hypothetical protein